MSGLVRDLVQQRVSVLVVTNNVAIEAARRATATVPVVMATSIDPVTVGYVSTLAHPGGNITGIANLQRELSGKRIEILREIVPKLSRLAILWDEAGPGPQIAFQKYEIVAKALKVQVQSLAIYGPKPELEDAFQAAKKGGAQAIIAVSNPTLTSIKATAMALALKHRIPSMVEHATWVDDGGLISYGASFSEISQRIAVYVDKILRGAKPADLPIEQPTKFELVINGKTAKALGLKIPQSLLIMATKVIE